MNWFKRKDLFGAELILKFHTIGYLSAKISVAYELGWIVLLVIQGVFLIVVGFFYSSVLHHWDLSGGVTTSHSSPMSQALILWSWGNLRIKVGSCFI